MSADESTLDWALISGLILITIGAVFAFAAEQDPTPNQADVLLSAAGGVIVAPLGTILYIIGCFRLLSRRAPRSRIIIGVVTLAIGIATAVVFPPNPHKWTGSLMLPLLATFGVGSLTIANSVWKQMTSRRSTNVK